MTDPSVPGPASQPQQNPYEAAPPSYYAAAPQPPYGTPPQAPYGAPPQPSYGAPPQQYYGTPPPYYYGALVPARNGFAVAALVLGICGFVLTPIPFFIGLVLGGIPDVLAVIFGIIGIQRAQTARVGQAMAIVGTVLGGLGFLSIFIGAGTIW